jgi:hypothetical protein
MSFSLSLSLWEAKLSIVRVAVAYIEKLSVVEVRKAWCNPVLLSDVGIVT